ncbi:putative E3 ubiquitin-protein ligase SINA-like 9 [Anoplophora glabripennis]|uniref:putative E3 ubiquitin-protein ligase SINA-like 9 n=1 Tax=Anoplophora glabripennis TaxID=217634 RepID=UPI0008751395|nr:putative E3 ubiquitin-protein ligase SINA-like 9 [Anoplophora glabripennis]
MEKQLATLLNEEFLSEFECPICTKYILPPIRQCRSGHCFCQDCFDKIPRCALCRAPKSENRSITLEKVQTCLTFPCLYVEEGCDFQAPCKEITLHQKHCKFSVVPCALRFNGCRWQGDKSEMIAHCRTHHRYNIFFTTRQKFRSSRFRNRIDRIYYIVFYVFNNLFRCTWDLDSETGLMRFAVYCLGKPLGKDRFGFEMSYLQRDGNTKVVTVIAPCYPLEDDSEMFLKGRHFVMHHELVKRHCDEDGTLNYSVNIFKRK